MPRKKTFESMGNMTPVPTPALRGPKKVKKPAPIKDSMGKPAKAPPMVVTVAKKARKSG